MGVSTRSLEFFEVKNENTFFIPQNFLFLNGYLANNRVKKIKLVTSFVSNSRSPERAVSFVTVTVLIH